MSEKFDLEKAVLAQTSWLEAFNLQGHPDTVGTPERVAEFWSSKLLSGYRESILESLGEPIPSTSGGIVSIEQIPFHSLCPHHLVPYFGHVDIAYEPNGKILGLGRFEKLIATCSRRLVLQEYLTQEIVSTLTHHLGPRGLLCRIKAQHLCFMLNGREPRATQLVTWHGLGTLEGQFALFGHEDEAHE